MRIWKSNLLIGVVILLTTLILLLGLYGLLKPVNNSCKMTYMFPNYINIPPYFNGVSSKYGLYLYHEGWKKKDFDKHLKHLNGIPVLFIPGNGGSYKQVRSLGAESDRAFQRGYLDKTFYEEGYLEPEELGVSETLFEGPISNQYQRRLDWFAVDLQGEYSAMDSQTLEDHTEYVVYAIHRILDHYKATRDTIQKLGAASSIILPKSVILVGHSMGGFVARAAVVHPHLRKETVETIITLSSPHQSPPVALQPSFCDYYQRVNEEWKAGYTAQTSAEGHYHFNPPLAHVIVISISGGFNDYQVRTRLESLNDIVPPTHGFMISSASMRNVWLSMEHQVILWCNQLVVQVSHTLLSTVDPRTSLPISDPGKRLAVFGKMLRSGSAHTSLLHDRSYSFRKPLGKPRDADQSYGFDKRSSSSCPDYFLQNDDDDHEKDLYIRNSTVTVLAMDGKRRWLDINNLGSNGKNHFIFVTNLSPCSGVRLHLWREKERLNNELAAGSRVAEVTTRLVSIPSGMERLQTEPGGQTEQASPSAMMYLHPHDMRGFRFLTISVAHLPPMSGRPAPPASMAVGQFFNREDGLKVFGKRSILSSAVSQQELLLEKDHPLAFNLTFAINLGLLPISISLNTTGCGIAKATKEDAKDEDASRLCKFLCFPPLALVWDITSGLHVFPNIYNGTIIVDSFPATIFSAFSDEKTILLLLVDPHCSYNIYLNLVKTVAASRFLLLYNLKVFGFCVALMFYAFMRQARAWQLYLSAPSLSSAINSNLDLSCSFWLLGIAPIGVSLLISLSTTKTFPSFGISLFVTILCYLFANGVLFLVAIVSHSSLCTLANIHVSLKSRYQKFDEDLRALFVHRIVHVLSSFSNLKIIRIVTSQSLSVTCVMAIGLCCLVHPAIGLSVLLLHHFLTCHYSLCSYFRERKRLYATVDNRDITNASSSSEESTSPKSAKTFGESQLEIFHHHHTLLILHSFAGFMFFPSLLAWFHRVGKDYKSPGIVDSIVSVGVILNGVLNSKPEFNTLLSVSFGGKKKMLAQFIYLLGGYYCYFCGLNLEPCGVLYAISAVGFLSLPFRIFRRGEFHSHRTKHSHRH